MSGDETISTFNQMEDTDGLNDGKITARYWDQTCRQLKLVK